MKAFLLAGGFGTRLKPLTDTTPKCLLPVRGIPMLGIWFSLCRKFGIEEVLVNFHSHGEEVKRFVQKQAGGPRIRLFEEAALLGSAGTVLVNRDWIRHEESFWIFYADVLTTANLDRMAAFHRSRSVIATIAVYEVPDPTRCGIAQLDQDGMVTEFVEKPEIPKGNLAFSGLMLARPQFVDLIPDVSPVDLGFHVMPRAVGRMAAYRVEDFLMDIGTLKNYRQAQEAWPGISQIQTAE